MKLGRFGLPFAGFCTDLLLGSKYVLQTTELLCKPMKANTAQYSWALAWPGCKAKQSLPSQKSPLPISDPTNKKTKQKKPKNKQPKQDAISAGRTEVALRRKPFTTPKKY
jgi:hypothetical protein